MSERIAVQYQLGGVPVNSGTYCEVEGDRPLAEVVAPLTARFNQPCDVIVYTEDGGQALITPRQRASLSLAEALRRAAGAKVSRARINVAVAHEGASVAEGRPRIVIAQSAQDYVAATRGACRRLRRSVEAAWLLGGRTIGLVTFIAMARLLKTTSSVASFYVTSADLSECAGAMAAAGFTPVAMGHSHPGPSVPWPSSTDRDDNRTMYNQYSLFNQQAWESRRALEAESGPPWRYDLGDGRRIEVAGPVAPELTQVDAHSLTQMAFVIWNESGDADRIYGDVLQSRGRQSDLEPVLVPRCAVEVRPDAEVADALCVPSEQLRHDVQGEVVEADVETQMRVRSYGVRADGARKGEEARSTSDAESEDPVSLVQAADVLIDAAAALGRRGLAPTWAWLDPDTATLSDIRAALRAVDRTIATHQKAVS